MVDFIIHLIFIRTVNNLTDLISFAERMKEENGSGGVTDPENQQEEPARFSVFSNSQSQQSLLDRFDNRWPAVVGHLAAVLLAVFVAWGLLLMNVSPKLMAVPGGSVASIFLLYVVSMAVGHAVGAIAKLPPLLGMMVAGIALQNCGLYTVTVDWCVLLVTIMRCAT